MGVYHRPVCVETVVGPLHHSSVEGWGRQQHNIDDALNMIARVIKSKVCETEYDKDMY